jgi:uncharacterized protein with FMN-binding domain
MKKYIVALIIVVLIGLFIFYRMSNSAPATVTPTPTPTAVAPSGTSVGSETTNPSATPTGSTPPPATTGAYKDGAYTGDVADAFYGKVQVKATISGGKITSVAFLQYPTDGGHTQQVSAEVMPILTQEVVKIQSANVDAISGATQTVEAFQQSLQSALAQAKA